MDAWKEKIIDYKIYCKEEKRDLWVNDILALDSTKFADLPAAFENQKKSFIKTAEIMKALDEGETWEQIGHRIMEGHEYCQYPIGVIGHMMLKYSRHGIEFVRLAIGDGIELMTALKEEFYQELEQENNKGNNNVLK